MNNLYKSTKIVLAEQLNNLANQIDIKCIRSNEGIKWRSEKIINEVLDLKTEEFPKSIRELLKESGWLPKIEEEFSFNTSRDYYWVLRVRPIEENQYQLFI